MFVWLSFKTIKFYLTKANHFHREKTRVQMPAKNVSSFEIIIFAVYGPHSWFWHKAKKQFLIKFGGFFYNKSKILTVLFIVKYEKITLFDEFLVLLGPIISRFFACSNEEKKMNKNYKRVLALVPLLCPFLALFTVWNIPLTPAKWFYETGLRGQTFCSWKPLINLGNKGSLTWPTNTARFSCPTRFQL